MKRFIIGLLTGSMMTLVVYTYVYKNSDPESAEKENKPLYWVAPMDPNYRRDQAGQSPMGMDLIPVYKNGNSDQIAGTITISPEVENNLGVRIATAKYDTLNTQIETVGYVRYDEDQLVHIHPRVEGWIEKLYVKSAGDPIEKGQALYEIYSPALVNAQEELVLALERNNSRLVAAAKDRLTALQLPQVAIDNLKKNRKIRQTITFFAPQSGVIDNLNIREGVFVKPATRLLSIGKLDPIWVEAEVFERQAFDVKSGQEVSMKLDYLPGKSWKGTVDYVYPTLDAKTRTVKVRMRFSNELKELKPNMFARVVIRSVDDKKTLLVPKEAVIRTGDLDRVVLALGEGRFRSVRVKLGRINHTRIEILDGLSEGQNIVSSAQFLLDSESSKTADFSRMESKDDVAILDESLSEVQSATVEGVIDSIMPSHGMLTISRGPIEKWNRPAATVDFRLDNSIDINTLSEGMSVQFTFTIEDGNLLITDIQAFNATNDN